MSDSVTVSFRMSKAAFAFGGLSVHQLSLSLDPKIEGYEEAKETYESSLAELAEIDASGLINMSIKTLMLMHTCTKSCIENAMYTPIVKDWNCSDDAAIVLINKMSKEITLRARTAYILYEHPCDGRC